MSILAFCFLHCANVIWAPNRVALAVTILKDELYADSHIPVANRIHLIVALRNIIAWVLYKIIYSAQKIYKSNTQSLSMYISPKQSSCQVSTKCIRAHLKWLASVLRPASLSFSINFLQLRLSSVCSHVKIMSSTGVWLWEKAPILAAVNSSCDARSLQPAPSSSFTLNSLSRPYSSTNLMQVSFLRITSLSVVNSLIVTIEHSVMLVEKI